MRYSWILFDADETLFHFDAFTGLKTLFQQHFNLNFTEQDYQQFELINKPLWVEYQNGKITAEQLKQQRFSVWANQLNICPLQLNTKFMYTMAQISTLLVGAEELISQLYQRTKLAIITNGFTELQQLRLDQHGWQDYFELVIVSEQVGYAKPHPQIFNHAFELMNYPDKNNILIVGDNPDSDILGGMQAGIDTCWLNLNAKPRPQYIQPTYEVNSLTQLKNIIIN
ncbi:MAG: hypothetical protein RLZZ293_902 [Pseudomonadota bacterium]|jgi:YjjG family noncanonical pyrimidine nucleotidase